MQALFTVFSGLASSLKKMKYSKINKFGCRTYFSSLSLGGLNKKQILTYFKHRQANSPHRKVLLEGDKF